MTKFEQNTIRAAIKLLQTIMFTYESTFSDGINAKIEECIRELKKLIES